MIDNIWKLHPTVPQAMFLSSTARFPGFIGGWASGKRLDIDTEIRTDRGWVTIGDVRDGDCVYGLHGGRVVVTKAWPIETVKTAYRLRFDTGEEVTADPDHLWYTISQNENKKIKRGSLEKGTVKTTQQIVDTLRTANDYENNHRIPVAEPLQGMPTIFSVQPYTLGAWLGDGDSRDSVITAEDAQVLELIKADGYSITKVKCRDGNRYRITKKPRGRVRRKIGGLFVSDTMRWHLRSNGVLNNKHIPDEYMRASISQRIDLLRGLMDSDGYAGPDGHCEFCSTKKLLADQVLELVSTLGVKARIYNGRATINGVDKGPKYRVVFKTKLFPVFGLQRKQDRIDNSTDAQMSRHTNRWIVDYEVIEDVPMRCLTVDDEDGLFLIGRTFIATHNTMIGIAKAMKMTYDYPENLGIIFRKKYTDLADSTMADFTTYTGIKVKSDKSVTFPNGSKILFHHLDELSGVAQNINLGWFMIEQAEELESEDVFNKLRGRLRRTNGVRKDADGNPVLHASGEPIRGLFDIHGNEGMRQAFIIANAKGHNWVWRNWVMEGLGNSECIEGTYKDHPPGRLPQDFMDDLEEMKEESPAYYRRYVMNSHEETDTEDVCIPYDALLEAVGRDLRDFASDITVISCDPAEKGKDKSVIGVFKGLTLVEKKITQEKELMTTVGNIMTLHRKYESDCIIIDDIGNGAGVRSRLREQLDPEETGVVMGFNSCRVAKDNRHYARTRDEVWMHAAELFKEGYVSLPEQDSDNMVEELSVHTYDPNSKGQICICRKKDVKKAIGHSPDEADMLVMGLWAAKKGKKRQLATAGASSQEAWNPLTDGLD